MIADSAITDRLVEAFLSDIETESPRRGIGRHWANLSHDYSDRAPLIYTAFDGDHFALVSLMREYVLSQGGVPVNPESVVGYKDALDFYESKAGVLEADLALVGRCDQLWVFTDLGADSRAVRNLPEGVATELLYFLKEHSSMAVRHIDIRDLIRGTAGAPTHFDITPESLRSNLIYDRSELVEFVDRQSKGSLPPVVFCLYDPLDSKYAHWIRHDSHQQRAVAVVPSLAIELGDGAARENGMANVLRCWAALLSICDTAWEWPSIDHRPISRLQLMFKEMLQLQHKSIRQRDWRELAIPKAMEPESWALTHRERRGPQEETA